MAEKPIKSYDCLVVGLGTAGAATCMTLARRGIKVLGIDQYQPPHNMGSHHGGSRSVRRAYLEGTSYVSMALRAWELWRKLEQDSGKKLLFETGNLTIGPPDCPAVSGFMASAQTYDIPHEYLSAAEITKRWPQLSPTDSLVGGLEKEAGIVLPEAGIATMLGEAEKAGATLVTGERVRQIQESQDSITLVTDTGAYQAEKILVSAGAWTRDLLDLPPTTLQPKRVPVHWIEVDDRQRFQLGNFPVNFWQLPVRKSDNFPDSYKEFYTLPLLKGGTKLKAAFHNGLDDCQPDFLDREVAPHETMAVRELLAQLVPGLDDCPVTTEVCLYTLTPDGHFFLGQRPGSQRIFGAALAGHGFKFAPVLGEILADLLCDIQPAFDVELFSPKRLTQLV